MLAHAQPVHLLVFLIGVLLAGSSVGLTGCAPHEPPYALHDISGLMPQLAFNLTDQDGRVVNARDYRGDVVLLYFGYTHCPDACPTTLAELTQAMRRLGAASSSVRVLFVSVDPQRDTAAVMKSYVGFFGQQFVGLRGDDASLSALAKRYRVAYHREPPEPDGSYAVEHSSAIFIFDRTGRVRLIGGSGNTPEQIAKDLRRLLSESA